MHITPHPNTTLPLPLQPEVIPYPIPFPGHPLLPQLPPWAQPAHAISVNHSVITGLLPAPNPIAVVPLVGNGAPGYALVYSKPGRSRHERALRR